MRNLYPHKNAKRESLMQLRWRHLDHVDSMARSNESIASLNAKLCDNFEYFFGPLRPKRKQVPSDKIRESIMVFQILQLVQERRENPDLKYEAQLKADVAMIQAAAAAQASNPVARM